MELWDIYDENKERTGRTMKPEEEWIKNGQQDGGKCLEAVYAPEKIRKMQ